MYEKHFKLAGRPFLAIPETDRYFPAETIETARRTLARSIERGEGPGVIIGPPGTGKSLLCRVLARQFCQRFVVALLDEGRFGTRRALLQAILHKLELPYRGLEEGELRLALVDQLDPKEGLEEGLLLIVDEAHCMGWQLLEEVRLLTNLVRDGQPRVRVVLAGNTTLEERFASPKLSSFSQRLAARCYLGPLDANETIAYVKAQIASVGGDPAELVAEEALQAIYRASDGIPRLVNQICDHALVLACISGTKQLTVETIDEAWADLQQLPVPWASNVVKGPADHVVEFAGLDEPCDEPIEAISFAAFSQTLNVGTTQEELNELEREMLDIDSDFEPAGSIGTEVDLDFPEFGDPFAETFEEEEVVLDRYGADELLFAARPRTVSKEGQQLGALLEAWAATRGQAGSIRLDPPPPPAKPQGVAIRVAPGQAQTMLEAQPSLEIVGRTDASRASRKQPQAAALLAGDCDILVVDDAEPMIIEPSAATISPKRKREYKNLFSKLRRG
jgi:type II secretory pathway predicted ATPase ExeA